jgi:hypothetical protein
MAVLVEGLSVIIRGDALLRAFGNFDRFKRIVPNETLCADNELVRVGFMHPDDVGHFISQLETEGLRYIVNGRAEDLVVADQRTGFAAICDWASFGHAPWGGDPAKPVGVCMLENSSIDEVVLPEGWTYEGSLTASFKFTPTEELETILASEEDGVQVVRLPSEDKPHYIGRTSSGATADPARRKKSWLGRLLG